MNSDIDAISEKILSTLERVGRVSNQELAQMVGLSPSACMRRVQELERRDIIRGYSAIIDRSAIGPQITVFVLVGLTQQLRKQARDFERAMEAAPQVKECHNLSGSVEYLLRVEVADLIGYRDFHSEVLGVLPQVGSITSHFCLGTSKDVRTHLTNR